MQRTPPKRRTVSPRAAIPINAANTPSRIPGPKNGATTPRSGRPSFASPTKASLSRHNHQLLHKTPPAVALIRPGSRGRNLDEVFSRALEKARPSVEAGASNVDEGTDGSTTQELERPDEHPFFNAQTQGPGPTRSFGGKLAVKPRRKSGSSFKQSPTKAFQALVETGEVDKTNPFVKTGLRRSPIGYQDVPVLRASPASNDIGNSFKKTGLRRSPKISQEQPGSQNAADPFTQKEVRRSPVGSQEVLEESTSLGNLPIGATEDLPQDENINPFMRKEIRRSGPLDQAPLQQENPNPLQSIGLGRSPTFSRPLSSLQNHTPAETSTTPKETPPRTSILGLTQDVVTQVEEDNDQENELPLPRLRPGQNSGPLPRPPILSDHPVLSDPEFSRAVEAALQSSSPVPFVETSPSPLRISQVETNTQKISGLLETEADTQNSTSFSKALEAAVFSSPSRRIRPPSRPISEPAEPIRPQERHIATDLHKLDSLVDNAILQNRLPVPKSVNPSLRSPARRPRQTVSPPVRLYSQTRAESRFRYSQREEPELPPTPTQLGLDDPIVTTPPSGVHDSPRKKVKRDRSLGQKLSSSPLKARHVFPQESQDLMELAVPTDSGAKATGVVPRRKSARFLVPVDPYAAKKEARDTLLRELQQIQQDISMANKENERLHSQRETRKSKPVDPIDTEQLVAMLLRSTAPEPTANTGSKPTSIFKSIGSFLPFSSRRKQRSAAALVKKHLSSHLPIAADEPLSYLQAFSPLVYTSKITISMPEQDYDISSQESEMATVQHHAITTSHPSGLFHARLNMTVDSAVPSITTLEIMKLDFSAERELGTFVRRQCDPEEPLHNSIGVVCWAMGRWVETSIKRAILWCNITHELGTAEARKKSLQTKKKRKHAKFVEEDEEDSESRIWTKKDLAPHMGRSAFELSTDEVEVRFEWTVEFDWSGEVESKISAIVRMPSSWQTGDECKSRSKIPEVFDRLVKAKGPLVAARVIIGLLMPY
ncbi:hypothetical protein BJ878DRAFT_520021 [Calycina marina]|uniref:Uncharacterized protein n=1 Tax=Calycina marina TaxID=1763456 RepID=A0A9P8CDR9_9HELO|nr:hypothetical protein BJ878DRAFT_520021 [Calycina marina]